MTRPLDERLLDDATVLTNRSPVGARALSAFEAAVVARIDGRTPSAGVAAAIGIRIDWEAYVGKHLGASLPGPQRVEAIATWATATTSAAAARGAAHACSDAGDAVAAVGHARNALRLDRADTTFVAWASQVEAEARRLERRQRIRSFFTLTPSAPMPKKRTT